MTRKTTKAPEQTLRRENPATQQFQSIHPLLLWRAQPVDLFHYDDVAALRAALGVTTLLHEPRWKDAVRGDRAAAVGIAAMMLPATEVTLRFDLAMSALCLNALRGCSAAALILAHVLNSLGRDDRSFKPLGTSWLGRNRTEASSVKTASKKMPHSQMRPRVRQAVSTNPAMVPPPPNRWHSTVQDAPISTDSVRAICGSGPKTRLRS